MRRPSLEVADVFHRHGAAWRAAHAGHLSLGQMKVMSAIEACRTAALGGHVKACEDCGHSQIAYNSCRNRHCPKCQGAAARDWLAAREADLLPVGYFHVVFTLPAEIADIAYQNKAVIYDLLFRAASEAMLTIATDPRHLGARIGITAVLHSWGSAMTHHPHVHMIVPGGGISLDGERWVSCRPGFLLPVRVLSKLFRRLFLAKLPEAHAAGRLKFFGDHAGLGDRRAFAAFLAPLRRKNWFVYAKPPFAGPEAVLAYLSRYTHRVAISNSRLIALDEAGVTFRFKNYRRSGSERYRTMTLEPSEFLRRFLLHVLPKGFHRIRHYGLLASAGRKANIARARQLLAARQPDAERSETGDTAEAAAPTDWRPPCPCCGGHMIVIETFGRGNDARAPPSSGFANSTKTP
ncbi:MULTISPECIES: IS91 family transposase [unclassified Mesorhizobium]|uniref:IS91 family transposase n=1 Tax=unclassified Mesorhizobium TaxID=325217 RepID=UPI00333B6AE5